MSVFWKVLVFKPKILKKAKIYIEKGILRIDSTGAERFVGHVPHNISLICLESLTRKGLVKKKNMFVNQRFPPFRVSVNWREYCIIFLWKERKLGNILRFPYVVFL